MNTHESDEDAIPARPPRSLYLFLWLAVTLILAVHHFSAVTNLWDARVYAHAIDEWLAGHNPYSVSNPRLLFVYPPVFLYASGYLAKLLSGHVGWFLYVAVYLASSLALPFVLARFYLQQPWLSSGCAYVLVAMQPRYTGFQALMAGNITSVFYCVLLLAAIPGIRRNRWQCFYFVIGLVALVKVNFLIMLLIPWLLGRRQWINSALPVLCVGAAYLVQKRMAPQLFEGFRHTLSQQIAGHDDYGYGVMRIAMQSGSVRNLAGGIILYLVQIGFVLALISLMFVLRRKRQHDQPNSLWIALVLLATILCNPRILQYDSVIGLLAGVVLLVSALRIRHVLLTAAVIFVPSVILVYLFRLGSSDLYETFVLLICFGAGYWRLSSQAEGLNPIRVNAPAVAMD